MNSTYLQENLGKNSTSNGITKWNLPDWVILTSVAYDFCTENSGPLLLEIKDDWSTQKDTLCLWTGKFNIVKMKIVPQIIYILYAILIVSVAFFSTDIFLNLF